MEEYFTIAEKVLASSRGFARAAVLGCVFFAILALLSLQSIGSGFFVFSLLALYFFGIFLWQRREYRAYARAGIMLDTDGLLVSCGGRDVLYGTEELYAEQGCRAFSLGFGRQARLCRALLVCGRELFVDVEKHTRADTQGAPVLGAKRGVRVLPLTSADWERLLEGLARSGGLRCASERAAPMHSAPETQDTRPALTGIRAAYLGGGGLAILAHILLENSALALVFLLAGLACAGLFVNTFYERGDAE